MQFTILHTLRYEYSRAVFLEPHELRMQPRQCGYQVLREFDLHVEPTPVGVSHCLDVEGNNVASVWFDGEHRQLTVSARSRVVTTRENPFDYLLHWKDQGLPMQYDASTAPLIERARRRVVCDHQQDEIATFADRLCQQAGGEVLRFLDQLNQVLSADFTCIRREEGDPWPPPKTFTERRGACRDLAVLFVEACRSVGIGARFVSGYQEGDTLQERRDLHAWAEVYVPGGGWRGFDPTHGLAVADRHVAVAASADPLLAAPVRGSYRGTDVTTRMEANIELRIDERQQESLRTQDQQQSH